MFPLVIIKPLMKETQY